MEQRYDAVLGTIRDGFGVTERLVPPWGVNSFGAIYGFRMTSRLVDTGRSVP
jgi:hypothetical protein